MNIMKFGILPTPMERAMGRIMRGPDHDASTATGEPAPGSTPEDDASATAAVAAAEAEAAKAPKEVTAEDLEAEFGGEPATDADAGAETEEAKAAREAAEAEAAKAAEPKPEEKSAATLAAEAAAAEAQRQAEYWKGVAEGKGIKPEKTAEEVAAEAADKEPKAEDYEFGEADAKFIADTARYHARQEFRAEQAQAALRAEVSAMEAKWQGNVAKVVAEFPDFDEVVNKGAEAGTWECPPIIALGIKDSDFGPAIAYDLAKNPAEASRIAKLSPIEQAREFGRIEARKQIAAETKAAEAAEAAKTPPETKPNVSKAPTPPSHIVRGAGGQFAASADTDDFSAFDKMADGILKRK